MRAAYGAMLRARAMRTFHQASRYKTPMIITDEDGYATFALFKCPACEAQVHDIIFVPSSSSLLRDEHGLSTQGEADIMCGGCTAHYRLEVRNSTGRVFAQVIGFPKVAVTCTGAVHRDELDDLHLPWDIENTPSDSLVEALKDIEAVIQAADAIFYVKALSRMAFIQQFAALEAYLADTLTQRVLECPKALSRALSGVDVLKDIRLSLADIAANPDIVKVTVAQTLRDLLYHNFQRVDAIWRIALEFSIFPDPDVKRRMFSCLPIRHDCVHRNGRDKDGNEHSQVNFEFVLQVGEDAHAMMMHIEDTLAPYMADDEDPAFRASPAS